jgi:hypothetical protein
MTADHKHGARQEMLHPDRLDARPYVLKSLLGNIRLAIDDNGDDEEIYISCVEFWSVCIPLETNAGTALADASHVQMTICT